MPKVTTHSTSMLWRYTSENGYRLSIRLSSIEEMSFSPEADRWSVRLSSGHQHLNLAKDVGNDLHEAWITHLETEATRSR